MSMQSNLQATQQNQASSKSNQWLTCFLESRVFLRLPAKNLQTLIASLEEINVKAGDTVISPQTATTHYYIIKDGSLDMLADDEFIATLSEGNSFGEEILTNDGHYHMTVIANTNCLLMRLDKQAFEEILVHPILQTASADAASSTNSKLIDTNSHPLHEHTQMLHIPFHKLRIESASLDKKTDYLITHINTGLGKASAFVLSQLGFSTTMLIGELPKKNNVTPLPVNDADELDPSLLAELDALDAQIKSLESITEIDITAPAAETTSAPKNTSIVCLENVDDTQLWTPMPVDDNMTVERLNIVRTKEESAPLLRTPEKTDKTPESSLETENWLADNYVWEKVLGFDNSDEVDELLKEEHQKTSQANTTVRTKIAEDVTIADTPYTNPVPNVTPATNTILAQHQARKQSKPSNAKLYMIAAVITVGLISWPFIAPNTWNQYYDRVTTNVSGIKENTLNELKNISLSTSATTAAPETIPTANTTKPNNDDQIQSVAEQTPPAVAIAPLPAPTTGPTLAEQQFIAFQEAKAQARAEFNQKLDIAVVPTSQNIEQPTTTTPSVE